MLSTAPELKIRTLLLDNWVPANTSNITPKIHTGWYNTAWNTTPQITITDPQDIIHLGGDTGISAFTGGGDLVRFVFTDVLVVPWAHREMVDSNGSTFKSLSINPKQFVWEVSNEIQRIIEVNMFSDPELEFVTWLSKSRIVEDRIQPIVFRYNNNVRLAYKQTVSS